jgi:hypothetical protein
MSSGLMVYAVDIDKLLAVCGSGDRRVRQTINERARPRIAQLEADFGKASITTAINHFIDGEDRTLDGVVYSYAYNVMVDYYFGEFLDNSYFYPGWYNGSAEKSKRIDADLEAAGASVRLKDLDALGAPIAFPHPEDFPGYGWWSTEMVSVSLPALRACAAKSSELQAIWRWLERAAGKNQGIVGFVF